ncbi:MAG: CHAT domain-containing protein [Candidatus Rokubacteria bacterium]|nr:CHAT domain-containing protein [Candidatus Rokubacteria bacterium]MBI2157287.1 CHAT domain-containing protein [Candidatus Rokubacteria bacterium]
MRSARRLLVLVLLAAVTLAWWAPAAGQGRGYRRPPRGAPLGEAPADAPPAPGAPASPAPADGKTFGLSVPEAQEAVERGEGRQALAFYERAAAAAEQRRAREEAGTAFACATFVAIRLGQLQKAITAGERARDLLRDEPALAPPQINLRVTLHAALGSAYQMAGDRDRARRLFEDGLTWAYAQGHAGPGRRGVALGVALLSRKLAQVAFQQRDFVVARDRALEAVSLSENFQMTMPGQAPARVRESARRTAAEALLVAARAQLALGDLDGADGALKRVQQYARLIGLAEMDVNLLTVQGEVALARNDPQRALALYQQALTEAGRLNQQNALIGLHQGAARAHAALRQPGPALVSLRRSMELVEAIRGDLQESSLRSGFVENKQGIYELAVRLALGVGQAEEAFGFAERGRARAFLDLLGGQTTLSKGRTRALVAEEVRLRARLAEARALAADDGDADARRTKDAVDAAEREYRAFLDRIRKESGEQASLMSVEPVVLADVQALLPEGTTLLEYMVTTREVALWVVERDRVKALTLPVGRADLVGRVGALRAAIASLAPQAEVERQARELHDRLLAPARAEIRGNRLLIVPHDVLHYLPFAALRSPDGHWLVEDYALATLPSASVLKYLAGKGAGAGGGPLALGNPDLGAALNLRYAEREARVVGETYPGATVLVRDQATEARVKALAGGAPLIHFATHAELNEREPLASALLLTPGQGEDGRLEVRELFSLDLHARLVILSACETGLGKLSRGDDLVGLQRAFLYAGTPAVVTTLWKVDDRASFALMREFYARLKAAGPGDALRGAQREALRAFPHPFGWAAYTLTGAPW